VQRLGGQVIDISPASDQYINPMDLTLNYSEDDNPLTLKSDFILSLMELIVGGKAGLEPVEKTVVDRCVHMVYREYLQDPRPEKMPVLGDLYDTLKESPDTKRLANIINRLVHGSARTFNQQTNVSLDNKYTVLDISELTGDLLTVGMFVALDYVWDKAKENRTEEKAIFIDECWQLIGANSNRLAAEFVLEIFKIIRGYGGSAICATQDINDFFALEDGKYGKRLRQALQPGRDHHQARQRRGAGREPDAV